MQIFLPDVCENYEKCLNGGTCIGKTNNNENVAGCKCIKGFHGKYCQKGIWIYLTCYYF